MEYIIVTMAVLSGAVIGYVNGRKNADEDWELRLRELAEGLVKDVDAGASGKKTEHSLIWHHGALWAINQMRKED
ncbi:MAG: hypothetical protein IKC24_05320 [Oscillospiraceae bacterium]|nr:hypothetical protein [Oscillospiraceae bacterium]